ncbi:SIR2 family NAD-dependent protein deacylase [Candidatus Amarolinea aalborgensis]|uniref:SIR2 family NAD-dependent protein deacylase n=1 Tax=Candidatus Amarolinea aalborgensis TaxID=2249329 RepID=UPI003BFA198A
MHTISLAIPLGLIHALRTAQHVAVLTGAGVSAESGVPTFREAQTGLWSQYNPEDLATPEAFRRQPAVVWQWYDWRRRLVAAAEPNAAHRALAALEMLVPRLTLITQNVDGLHQRAGSTDVIELHGNLQRVVCSRDHQVVTSWAETEDVPPRCPQCQALLRPDVVWFGESLPQRALQAALDAARDCDVFLSVGTSAVVQPAASLPYEALEHGAITVEVNPSATALTEHATYVLPGPAGQVLPALLHAAWHEPGIAP